MARTAFEEALLGGSDVDGNVNRLPSYMTAADTLSNANRNESFLQSASGSMDSVQKFIGLSVISGANQIYNIPRSIGNLFGGDAEIRTTEEVVSSLDSDMQAFYKDHQGGTDLVGFMLSSLVPGLGGVKILNAGQKSLQAGISVGKYGKNMGKALGLLAPNKANAMATAVKQVANNSAPASITNAKALRAIGAGLGQNVLEAFAFETAVAATLYDSPILENQDFGDFVSNVAIGGLVFGAFGAAIDGAKVSSALKGAANKADLEARPWTFIEESAKVSTLDESISLDLEQLKNIPAIPTGLDPARASFLASAAETKVRKLANRVRSNVGTLAKGDQEIAETYYQMLKPLSIEEQQANYIGLTNISRMGTRTKEVAEIEKLAKQIETGHFDLDDPELLEFMLEDKAISYTKTWGDDAGAVYDQAPTLTRIIDTIGPDEKIKVGAFRVDAGEQTYRFSITDNTGARAGTENAKNWDILEATPLETQARYIWSRSREIPSFATTLAAPGKGKVVVGGNDIPMLEKLLREVPDAMSDSRVSILMPKEAILDPKVVGLQDYLFQQKIALANKFLLKNEDIAAAGKTAGSLTQEQISATVNVRTAFLSGEQSVSPNGTGWAPRDMLALDSYAEDYAEKLIRPLKDQNKPVDIWNVPQHVRSVYDMTGKAGGAGDNFVVENMVIIKEQQKIYQASSNNAAAVVLGGDVMNALPDITTPRVRNGAVPSGAGAGRFTGASSNYGTLAALAENIGNITSRTIEKFKTNTRNTLETPLYNLGQNQEAAVEWSVLNANMRNIPGEYALNQAGDALEPVVVKRWKEQSRIAAEAGTEPPRMYVLQDPDMPLEVAIQHQATRDFISSHIQVNGTRTEGLAGIRAAQGVQLNRAADAFYPIPVNPQEYKHFAMVVDSSVTGGGANRTLFAASGDELEGMIKKLRENPELTILTKGEAEEYYKSLGQWDYEKTLNSQYLNTEAKRVGSSASYLVSTDSSKIVDDALSWHMQRESGIVREAVSAKYEVQFEELKRLGDEATNIQTSKFSDQSLLTFAEEAVKNPFGQYIKTALAVKDTASYPWWTATNRIADQAVSTVGKKVSAAFYSVKDDSDIGKINSMLSAAGYKGAAYDQSMAIFANSAPASGLLSTTVQKANSTLATIVLRMDFLNAVNNAVSANVLLGAETKAVIRAIGRGDAEAVGALSKLTQIDVPGSGEKMFAPTKLISNAITKLHKEGLSGPTMQFYRDNGYLTSITDQYRDAIETLTFTGRESVGSWNGRLDKLRSGMRKLGDAGEKWTGNKFAEEFNRFVAADVMKQMTDVGVTRGLITAKEQRAYINTFVNRTQGNYLASQRPMAFQGPIGQAMGLFQTYQFNLIQQLLRHAGEGHAKDAMTLMALQGTIHGMNGLPAFNAVNTHIIGSASGNQKHRDAYDATYGIAGKTGGDFLMYGIASSAMGLLHPDLKVNLYTRGDINPRHVTILPNNPSTVPIVQAFGKFAANIITTSQKIAAGGDVGTTLIQGLEHNGISRPLAGLAQTLEAFNNPQMASYSTSKRGNVIAANDLMSLANFARIAGGKPLDEAIALDATYRFRTYGLKDARSRDVLGKAIKSTMMAGNNPTQEQIEGFAEDYAARGGRQQEFAGWFGQLYKTANASQANQIQKSLSSPFTQSMQQIMGGETLRDFSN